MRCADRGSEIAAQVLGGGSSRVTGVAVEGVGRASAGAARRRAPLPVADQQVEYSFHTAQEGPSMDDLRIVGAHILDPAGGTDAIGDIAVSGGRVRAIGEVPPAPARTQVPAHGLLATPGLVDLHTHLHAGGTFWGLSPDPIAWYTGVTTWVDAGSVGAYGLQAMLSARRDFTVRSAIMLHISAHGLSARTGESRDLAFLNADAATTAICRHRDEVRGIKVRMDSSTVGDNGLRPLEIALQVGEATGVPVMVHIGRGPFGLDEVVDLLRPGDVITHCSGRGALGIARPGTIRDSLQDAYRRGVIFDIGHGAGGFSFEVLDGYLELGMPPHTISSDLHVLCASGPAFDLPTVMAKLLAAGLPLADVVRAATGTPAGVLGLDAGTLAPGAPADLALFQIDETPTPLGDVHGVTRTSTQRLRNVATFVGGRRLAPAFPPAPPSWVPLSDAQRAALDRRERLLREMLCEPLVTPDQVQNQIPTAPAPVPAVPAATPAARAIPGAPQDMPAGAP
jgi:dihydroorotase